MNFSTLKNHFLIFTIFVCTFLNAAKNFAQSPSLIPSKKDKQSLNIEDILKHSMFVKVMVSKNKIFVGEPVMALYKYYTSVRGQATVLKQPQFSGCSVTELNFNEIPQDETINGQSYTAYIIRKVQLTPIESGVLSIGVASVNNHVELPDANDVFNYNKYDINSTNDSVNINVIDLPEKNKPAGFYGITGTFIISASVSDNKIAVNENDHLIITVKGSGNLDAINKPDIVWPEGTEHFDGSDSQHIDQNNFPVSGDKVFDIPFVGKKEGTIKIPSVHFSYFNPEIKNYQTISTDSIPVTFTKALPKTDEYKNIVNYDISNHKYLWIVGAIAIVAALIGFTGYYKNKNQAHKNNISETTATPVPVFETEVHFKYKTDFLRHWKDWQSLDESKPFFTKGKELLMKAISEFVNSNHNTELFLLAEMKNKLTDETLCSKVFALVQVCNEKIYAPFETETDLTFYFNEIKDTIEKLQVLN